jgi:hypothetical protein
MATPSGPRLHQTARVPLLGWVIVLAAIVVGAVVGVGKFDDAGAVAVAGVAALGATLTILIVVRDELAATDAPARARVLGVRRPAAALGVASLAALAIAAYATSSDARDASTSAVTAVTAVRTVRDFVVAAGVDHDGEAACGLLTTAEQARVGAAADGECPQLIDDGVTPTPDGVTSEGAVRGLPATVSVRDGRATVRLGTGHGAATFVLARATFAEQGTFDAPASGWRIAAGAAALAGGGP